MTNPTSPNPLPDKSSLVLEDATFAYVAKRYVVEQVTAELAPGRITAVIGPNAAGKTTLVKLMLGELRPTRGKIKIGGDSVGSIPSTIRARQIAYIPQRGGVQFAFTVSQVVAMGRFAHRDERGVIEAIEQCDLQAVADRPFAQLSGGQQQRVLLARAVAQLEGGGHVLLADEPAAGMDLRHQLRMMSLLQQLAQRGIAVLVVVHDLNLAAAFADDVWLMDHGRLVQAGAWSQVLQPEVLEPVYGVNLRVIGQTQSGRPVLAMDDAGTMFSASETSQGTEP